MQYDPSNLLDPDKGKPIMWNLDQGVQFARNLELSLMERGYHVALSGGVLFKGSSTKDLDIIIYPHQSCCEDAPDQEEIGFLIRPFLDGEWKPIDHKEYDDEKLVFKGLVGERVVDFFLLQ